VTKRTQPQAALCTSKVKVEQRGKCAAEFEASGTGASILRNAEFVLLVYIQLRENKIP